MASYKKKLTDESEWKKTEEEIPNEEDSTKDSGEELHYLVKGDKSVSMIDPTEWELGEVEEPIAVPDGTEATLKIISVRTGVDKNGNSYWQPLLEIMEEPTSKDFTHFLHVPSRNTMSAKQYTRARYALQEFMDAFELDYSRPFSPGEDWPGSEGTAILNCKETQDYGMQNGIAKLLNHR